MGSGSAVCFRDQGSVCTISFAGSGAKICLAFKKKNIPRYIPDSNNTELLTSVDSISSLVIHDNQHFVRFSDTTYLQSSLKEEAKGWQVRASHVFNLGDYSSCIEYVNLALKYTPADSKRTFSLLLCQRSQAEQQLGDDTTGLEDAKKASMMSPEMPEVIPANLIPFHSKKVLQSIYVTRDRVILRFEARVQIYYSWFATT